MIKFFRYLYIFQLVIILTSVIYFLVDFKNSISNYLFKKKIRKLKEIDKNSKIQTSKKFRTIFERLRADWIGLVNIYELVALPCGGRRSGPRWEKKEKKKEKPIYCVVRAKELVGTWSSHLSSYLQASTESQTWLDHFAKVFDM